MRLYVYVNDASYSDAVLQNSLEISQDISDRVSTLDLTFKIRGGAELARYDTALYDESVYAVDVRENYNIVVQDASGKRHFGGRIARIEFERQVANLTYLRCSCVDYTAILDRITVASAEFTGQTDRAIIQSLIATYAPSLTSLTANIAQIETIQFFEVKGETLRDAIERLCALTGAEWRVDYNANLKYFVPTAYPSPFGLSSSPNTAGDTNITVAWNQVTQTWEQVTTSWDANFGSFSGGTNLTWNAATQSWDSAGSATWDDTTSMNFFPTYGIDAFTAYTRDFVRPVNSCRVLGGFLPGGAEIDVTYEDPISVLEYGRQAHTLPDREITNAFDAMLRAKALVNQYAYPEESFTLSTKHDGLEVGQSLPVYHSDFQISGAYVIRSIRLKQLTGTITNYELDLGVKPPDELRLLRQLEARSRRSTRTPVALAADGSVTTSSIGEAGINTSVLIGTITGTNVAVDADNIFGTISGNDVTVSASVIAGTISGVSVIVDANTIQGVLTGDYVSVDVNNFEGLIASQHVIDGLIDRLSMYSSPLQPIQNFATQPTIPSAAHPLGSFYYNTTIGQFYQNTGFWVPVDESTAVSGKLEYFHIGTIKAGKIVGLIAAAQINEVNAGSIIGQISADRITAVNASALLGSISADRITAVNATALQGNISADRITAVNVSAFVGKILGNQIENLTITGANMAGSAITADKIANLTITGSKIANLTITGTEIANLAITDAKVSSLSVGKLTGGTISASVTMTSPTLVISSGSETVNIDAGNHIKVTNSSFGRFAQISAGKFRCELSSDQFRYADISVGASGGLMQVGNSGSTVAISATLGLLVNGTKVVGAQGSPVSDPSGGSVVDVQCRAQLSALLSRLRGFTGHGLIS